MSYLDTIKQGAINAWHTRQILPSIAGAQAILETGSGTSDLARPPHNNHFGIKASADWTGRKVTMSTREYISGSWVTLYDTFRSYDTITESFEDYGAFFTGTPWRTENYKHVVGETDYKRACWALQNSGYATDPQYATKLITRIENNNLQAWDVEALSNKVTKSPTSNKQVLTPAVKTVGGTLTNVAKETIKELNITMIGDSLGVGTRTHFQTLAPKANFDVVGSRQITHATNSLNGTKVLTDMKNAGTLREYVVFIIGTNRGVTQTEVDNVVSIAGTDRKVLFVDTASEVNHASEVSNQYRQASVRHTNAFYVNWAQHAKPMLSGWYSADGAGGAHIHMNSEGYRNHAEYIAQAVYQSSVGTFTGEVATPAETTQIGIKDIDLAKDGTVKFKGERILEDGTTVVVDETTNIGIQGLHSPLGDESIYYPEANANWGGTGSVNNSLWIEGRFELSEEGDPIKLIKAAAAELINRGQASVQYTVALADMPPSISIGDTGIFRDHEFYPPLYIRARVLQIITSETDTNGNKVVIGNATELIAQDKSDILAIQKEIKQSTERLKRETMEQQPVAADITSTNGFVLGDAYNETQLVTRLKRGVEDVTQNVSRVAWERVSNDTGADNAYNQKLESVRTATLTVLSGDIPNGYSKFVARMYNEANQFIQQADISIKKVESALWVEPTEPTDAKNGATWVDENGKQWIKKDGEWEERVDQEVISQVRVEVEGAMAEAEQAKQEAVDAYENAVADAKAHAEAEVQASKERFDNLFEEVELDVAGAQATANSAVEQINTAIENAGFTSLDDTIKNISGIASGVKSELDIAIENAGFTTLSETLESTRFLGETAHADAQTAIDNAQTAQSKALEALGKADDANQGVSDLDVRVDDVEGELELKANNAYIDSEGTLTTLSNAITINAERFSSDMQRIESKVEVLSGEVNLVILRNAFVGKRLLGGEVYPNATVSQTTNDTMAEMITVVPGEKIALSKRSITGDNSWRINLYDTSGAYVTRYASDLNQVVYTIPAGIVKMWVSYPQDSRPQIVRGELFVPYRPNMADQMTTEEVVIFRNEYDEFAEGTSRRLTAIDSSGGRLDIAETNIQTTAEGLQTAVGRIDGTDTALSTLEQTASGLQSQVFNADGTSRITQLANGLQSAVGGGRNLLSGTRDFSPNPIGLYNVNNFDIVDETALDFIGKRLTLYIQSPTSGTSLNRGIYLPKELFKADREYIFSFYGRNWDGYAPINALASSGTITHLSSTDEGNLFKRHVFKITNNTGEIYIRPNGNGVYESTLVAHVVMPQLEYGSQVTPYSQSPKDAVSQSQITQLSDSITSSISGVDERVNLRVQTLEDSLSAISDPDTGRLSVAEQSLEGFQDAVYNADGTSKITQLATGISSVVNNLSELDISGRNLVVTGNEVKDYFIGSTGSLEFLAGSSVMRDFVKVTPGEVLTFTKQSKGDNYWRIAQLDGTVVYKSRFVNQANELQYTVPAGIGYLRVSYPTGSSPKIERGNKATPYSPAPEDIATQSQITQLADSVNLRVAKGDVVNQINVSTEGILIDGKKIHITGTTTIDDGVIKNAHIGDLDADKITSGTIDTARLNAVQVVTNGLSANVVTSTHLKTDEALIDELFATSALIDRLTSKTAFISQLKAIDLVADKASFVKAGWQSLNSNAVIDGNRMRVQNTNGDFIELNNSPELRSDDAAGTAVVLGKGRVHFYDSAGNSKGYVGSDIHTSGNRDFGTYLSKGGGTYRFARMAGAKSLTYDTYTVRAGRTNRVAIIEDMVIAGLLPDGNSAQFNQKSDMIAKFHGWSVLPADWPTRQAGDQIRYRERTVATTGDAYQTIWKAGTSSGDTWKVWFTDEVVFEGGYTQSSDRRLKHDIETSHIAALEHIESLAFKQFKWNKDGQKEPLGIIAQDSGLIRKVGGTEEEMEGVDGFRATILALKGIQELNKVVKEQAAEIKQLKEIIHQ